MTVTNSLGATLYAQVSAINNAGIEGAFSSASVGTILLDPNGDYDHDGMSNANEDFAGTNPLDSNSVFRVLSLTGSNLLTWSSVAGKTYRVWTASNPATAFSPVSTVVTGNGPTASYLDSSATNLNRFYRVNVLP